MPVRPSLSKTIATAAATGACVAVGAAPAHAQISAPPIPGVFVYHYVNSTDDQGNPRCGDSYGVQFVPVPKAVSYVIDYYDGYYNSEFSSGYTVAQLMAEGPFETPTLLYHGITGGNGPGPCTPRSGDDGGRFPKPATVIPTYPDGYVPPLTRSTSKATPRGAATATIRAAKGTFPVGSTANVEIVLKATGGRLTNPKPGRLRIGGALAPSLDGPTGITLAGHRSATFTTTITRAKAGTAPLSVTFSARTKAGRRVTVKATGSITFG